MFFVFIVTKMALICSVVYRYVFNHVGMWLPFYFVMLALTCAALVYILVLFVSEPMFIILWVKVVRPVLICLTGVSAPTITAR